MAPRTPWPSDPPPPGEIVVVPRGGFAAAAATRLAASMREIVGERPGPLSLALAGGSTPRPVYAALAETANAPWGRIEVFFGDERAVPPDDPDSNYRMARESLLDRVPMPDKLVHRMKADAPSLEDAAAEYASVLPKALDLVILGIGTDGHTASLFPGADTLRAEARVVRAVSPAPPRDRLTVTPPVLACALRIVVLAAGEEKAAPVARALTGPWDPEACPAQLARRGLWLLDTAAASALPTDLQKTLASAEEVRP